MGTVVEATLKDCRENEMLICACHVQPLRISFPMAWVPRVLGAMGVWELRLGALWRQVGCL